MPRIARILLLLGAVLPVACASSGAMNVWVADEKGGPIPGVVVTAGEKTAVSNQDGLARFSDLRSGEYAVDAEDTGYKSCGPLSVTVSAQHDASAMLVMRTGTIAAPYSQIVFKACPGRPDSAVTMSTSPKRARTP